MSSDPSGVTIRAAAAPDLPRITAIYAHYVASHLATFETVAPDVDEMRARHARLVAAGYPFLVAERDARLLGYAYAGPHRERHAYRYTVEDSIYLDPSLTGQGVGVRLLGALIDASAAAGFRQMVAVIGDSANRASIRVHARCGFATIGTMPGVGYKLGRWVDCVIMQRALG